MRSAGATFDDYRALGCTWRTWPTGGREHGALRHFGEAGRRAGRWRSARSPSHPSVAIEAVRRAPPRRRQPGVRCGAGGSSSQVRHENRRGGAGSGVGLLPLQPQAGAPRPAGVPRRRRWRRGNGSRSPGRTRHRAAKGWWLHPRDPADQRHKRRWPSHELCPGGHPVIRPTRRWPVQKMMVIEHRDQVSAQFSMKVLRLSRRRTWATRPRSSTWARLPSIIKLPGTSGGSCCDDVQGLRHWALGRHQVDDTRVRGVRQRRRRAVGRAETGQAPPPGWAEPSSTTSLFGRSTRSSYRSEAPEYPAPILRVIFTEGGPADRRPSCPSCSSWMGRRR